MECRALVVNFFDVRYIPDVPAVYPIRVAVISDVHANLIALEAVIADIREHARPHRIIGLGDFVFGGPEPAATVDLLQRTCDLAIAGNTDPWITRRRAPSQKLAPLCQWATERLSTAALEWLAMLPAQVRSDALPGLLGVHATPRSDDETVMPDADERAFAESFGGVDAGVIVCGHIHIPYVRPVGQSTVVGVGSVGFPADGDPRASYAVLEFDGEQWTATHRRVPYDVDAVVSQIRRSGMPDAEDRARRLIRTGD